MKGVVFTEFLDFVAARYGDDMVDDIIDDAALPSGGAYTTVGTYAHAEMVSLCTALAARTGEPAGGLVSAFGTRLSGSFARAHPVFFERAGNLLDFLASIEAHIHVEVRKLYPDAELPTFTVEAHTPRRLVMVYRSPRRMAALAEGLIHGSAREYGVAVAVQALPLDDDGSTRFVVDVVDPD